MFLIVFITLMVSIIGLYAQVLSLQTAKINAAQSSLTQTMMTWHGAAVAYSQSLLTTTDPAYDPPSSASVTTGCLLSVSNPTIPTGLLPCVDNGGNQLTFTSTNPLLLSAGFNSAFGFLTFLYQPAAGSTIYAVTYIDPRSIDGNNNLILPTTPQTTVGYTINDVMRQFGNISSNYMAYGTVNPAGSLTLGGKSNGAIAAGYVFPIPLIIPSGAVAIISAAN